MTRRWSDKRFKLLAVFAAFLALAGGVAAGEPKYAHEFYHDFRGKALPAELEMFGKGIEEFARSEPAGFRITLPKERDTYGPVGVKTTFAVRGDFEITVAVEILKVETPKSNFGVGATMYVNKADAPTEGSTIGRLMRPGDRETVVWDRSPGVKYKFDGSDVPCDAKVVRLRLKRTGTSWMHQWAPGLLGEEFVNLHPPFEFGADDLKQVTLRCATGGQPCSADVRFLELRVRSGGRSAHVPAVAPENPVKTDAPPKTEAPATSVKTGMPGGWLLAVLALGMVLTVVLVVVAAVWLVLRQRQGGAGEAAANAKRSKK
jgi:hypothetical protein